MSGSFFFYDLETSGVSAKNARIMQFAGQRTDEQLNPIGDPYNILIKLSEDILPEPDAILITGITPQMTLVDGITEAEFFDLFCREIAIPNTTFVGFNNIRFDDEFMRYGLFRNFYDSYTWQWKDGSSRWDMLDVVRLTRALRPEGINWPFASDGKPTNRLELLTSLNGLDHENAHDALNDVMATIAVARMIREKQPKLFSYLYSLRSKQAVEQFVQQNASFIYVSGKYSSEFEKLSVVTSLGVDPKKSGVFVFDLRYDPEKYLLLSPEKLVELWQWTKDPDAERLPVKTLAFNRCPAISPTSVLRDTDKERLAIDLEVCQARVTILKNATEFYKNLVKASEIMQEQYRQTAIIADEQQVDTQLYDGFIGDNDKRIADELHKVEPTSLAEYVSRFKDARLQALIPLYKARNFPKALNDEERAEWEAYKQRRIEKQLPGFMRRLEVLSQKPALTNKETYLLQELELYAQSVVEL